MLDESALLYEAFQQALFPASHWCRTLLSVSTVLSVSGSIVLSASTAAFVVVIIVIAATLGIVFAFGVTNSGNANAKTAAPIVH